MIEIKKEEIKEKLNKLKTTGFFSIFISNIFSQIIVFLGNIVVVRILSQNDYGIYAYAINAMNMLYIFNDLGASNAALQNLTEQNNNKLKCQAILKYAFKLGFCGSIISGILILISPLFYPYEILEAKYVTPMLFLIPVFSTVEAFICVILRANFENKKYAVLNLSKTIFSYIFLIPLCIFWGIKGAIISRYIYTTLTIILGIFLIKKIFYKFEKKNNLDKVEKKSFLKYAFVTQLNNTIGSVLLYIDTFMIGLIIATSQDVAIYKVAATIPAALAFLPNCVMTYVLPYFVLNNKNVSWLKNNYYKLMKYGAIAYGIITIALIVCSYYIIIILYTKEYIEAILPFIVLTIGFFFNATFKIPGNNILYAIRKLRFKLYITIISGVLNIVLNIVFIKWLGVLGAAITTTTINIFTSILGIYYIKKVISNMECEGEN